MSYYGKGTIEGILAYLGTVVGQIAGVGFTDYQRTYDDSIDASRYPGAYINHVRTDNVYVAKDIVRNRATVAIVGWVWAADGQQLGTLLNSFIDSVATAVRSDPTCGSKAYSTEIRSVTTDGGNRHPQGQFVMMLDIIFYSSR